MAVLKCKMCGGALTVEGGSVAICEYCGTRQTVSKTTDDVVQNLFNRANDLRIKCEFDRAEQTYERILEHNNADAEAYWGLVLCRYGIEYVSDPESGQKIPTCHRASFDSILADTDYQAAIELADREQKELYRSEAKRISEIQEDILRIAESEEPFDVFLCYKETDENGKRTVDSVITNDIYYQLIQEGYKVFYAPITLEDKLGSAYEPYIFSALQSAKVMLVIGTKPEYFNATWVKNEWSRFLKLVRKDRSKLLIPCYKDMDPYDLPDSFAHLQAQDMSKIGFINDVVRGIKKIVVKEQPQAVAPQMAEPVVLESAFRYKKAVDREPTVYNPTVLTKAQRVLFLIAAIFFMVVQVTEILKSHVLLPLVFWGAGLLVTLVLTIVIFKSRKKGLGLLLFALIGCTTSFSVGVYGEVPVAVTFYTCTIVALVVFLVFCIPFVIPKLSKAFRWVSAIFWIPPVLVLGPMISAGVDNDLDILMVALPLTVVPALLLALAVIPSFKKVDIYPESTEKDKKISLRNGLVLLATGALFVALAPSGFLFVGAAQAPYLSSEQIRLYEESHLLSDEAILEMKYKAVTGRANMWYLPELAAANYKDSVQLWDENTKWEISFDCCYADGEYLDYVPVYSNSLEISFILNGGKPGKDINVYHTVSWPGEGTYTADWAWERVGAGQTLTFVYENGHYAETKGDMVVTFYRNGTSDVIGKVTIPVR